MCVTAVHRNPPKYPTTVVVVAQSQPPQSLQLGPVVVAAVVQLGFVIMSFAIEWLLSRGQLDEYFGMQLHYLNAHTTLALPTYVVWKMIDNPAAGLTLLFHAVISVIHCR